MIIIHWSRPDYRATPYEVSAIIIDAAFRVLPAVSTRCTNLRAADTSDFAAYSAGVCLLSARCGRRCL